MLLICIISTPSQVSISSYTVQGQFIKNNGNAFLYFLLVFKIIKPHQLNFTLVNAYNVQQTADCRGFACAVLTINPIIEPFGTLKLMLSSVKPLYFFVRPEISIAFSYVAIIILLRLQGRAIREAPPERALPLMLCRLPP